MGFDEPVQLPGGHADKQQADDIVVLVFDGIIGGVVVFAENIGLTDINASVHNGFVSIVILAEPGVDGAFVFGDDIGGDPLEVVVFFYENGRPVAEIFQHGVDDPVGPFDAVSVLIEQCAVTCGERAVGVDDIAHGQVNIVDHVPPEQRFFDRVHFSCGSGKTEQSDDQTRQQ